MAHLAEIVSFIETYRAEYDEKTIRERLSADGCSTELIDEAFKTIKLRDSVAAEDTSSTLITLIFAVALAALGLLCAQWVARNWSRSQVPTLKEQPGEVNQLPSRPGAPAGKGVK